MKTTPILLLALFLNACYLTDDKNVWEWKRTDPECPHVLDLFPKAGAMYGETLSIICDSLQSTDKNDYLIKIGQKSILPEEILLISEDTIKIKVRKEIGSGIVKVQYKDYIFCEEASRNAFATTTFKYLPTSCPKVRRLYPAEGAAFDETLAIICDPLKSVDKNDYTIYVDQREVPHAYILSILRNTTNTEDTIKLKVPKGIGSGTVKVQYKSHIFCEKVDSSGEDFFQYHYTATVGTTLWQNADSWPLGIGLTLNRDVVFADGNQQVVLAIDKTTGQILKTIGKVWGGDCLVSPLSNDLAAFQSPVDVTITEDDRIFISDYAGHMVCLNDKGSTKPYAGDCFKGGSMNGKREGNNAATLNAPTGLSYHQGEIYFADNNVLRKITYDSVVTIPTAMASKFHLDIEFSEARPSSGPIYAVAAENGKYVIKQMNKNGSNMQTLPIHGVSINKPESICMGTDGVLFVADDALHQIVAIYPNNFSRIIAGEPGRPGSLADMPIKFNTPSGVAVDMSERNPILYVSDKLNGAIRKIILE